MKKRKTNLIVVAMLLMIGIIFGFSLEVRNLKIEQADEQFLQNQEAFKDQLDKEISDKNSIDSSNNDSQSSGLYSNFDELFANANKIVNESTTFKSEITGTVKATITKSGLVSAGFNPGALSMVPGSGIELNNQIKIITKKDKRGNKYLGLGFWGTLPDFASNIDVANRLNVAHYFNGMTYYVGSSKDKRVEQNCDPYVDTYAPMTYDEYMDNYYNDIGDIFYDLAGNVLEENIVYFSKPSRPTDGYQVKLDFTGEQLAKVTEKIDKQHKLLLNFAGFSTHKALSITLDFNYNGTLTKMSVTENFDTLYALMGYNVPIDVNFTFAQTLKYNNNAIIDVTQFID